MDGEQVLTLVEAHLLAALGPDSGRAGVTFLGVERIDVLRFGPTAHGQVHYVTVGMSRYPAAAAGAELVPTEGPRTEMVLSLTAARDGVLRPLAVLAAAPSVEGLVPRPGALIDLAGPLWPGAPFSVLLVGQPGAVPEVALDEPDGPVTFLPVIPVTAAEAAVVRSEGGAELLRRLADDGQDLRDPDRNGLAGTLPE